MVALGQVALDPGWLPSDTITVASVFVAAGAGVLGAWLGARWSRQAQAEERAAAERFAVQSEAFKVLGPISAMLVDLHPDRLGINAGPEMVELLKASWGRWTSDLRDRTFTLAASHPDAEVRRLAGRLSVQMHNANAIGGFLVHAVLKGQDLDRLLEEARDGHTSARSACDELAARLRGDAGHIEDTRPAETRRTTPNDR